MFTSIIGWFIGGIVSGLLIGLSKKDSESKSFGYGVAFYNSLGMIFFIILNFLS